MAQEKIILGIIPARWGSERVPKKNIKLFRGKPLIYYTIEAAAKSKYLNDFFVSTDGKEIADIAAKYGARVINRPSQYAQDHSPSIDVVIHTLTIEKADIVVLLQPTSPLRTEHDIDEAIKIFLREKPMSLISTSKNGPNGAIYISTPEVLKRTRSFYTKRMACYIMSPERSLDIDIIEDFKK
jgi:CMP-N-acetylneuraminic acid synthetase